RDQGTVGAPDDGAGFDGSAQTAVADGMQDRVGEFAGVARGAERTGACRVDCHSEAKRMTAAEQPDALSDLSRETCRGDRRIAVRPRKWPEPDVEEVLPVLDRPARRWRDGAGENETRACGKGRNKFGPKPGCRQAPGVDIVDHDDGDVLDARKRRCKFGDRLR